jgi:hypothetical protein
MPARTSLSLDQETYIRQNFNKQTDKQIADALGITRYSVMTFRASTGLIKSFGTSKVGIDPIRLLPGTNVLVNQGMNEYQRKEFFKNQLANSLFYSTLKQQFTEDEIAYYLDEWGALCVQFEDIVATEKRQIDELIKAEIMGNRILRNIRISEDELKKIINELEQYRKAHPDLATDEEKQERDDQLMSLTRILAAQSEAMGQSYQKNVDVKNKILDQLNARRKDRIDQIKRINTTFIGIVEKFRERDLREKEGRHMELIRISKEAKKAEWRKPITFSDGQNDCVLLDEKSILPEKDMVIIERKDNIWDKYYRGSGKRILILDLDAKKGATLDKYLKKDNKVDLIKMPDIAKALIKNNKYDLICIGENMPAADMVKDVLNLETTRDTDYLLYSDTDSVVDFLEKSFGENTQRLYKTCYEDIIKQS